MKNNYKVSNIENISNSRYSSILTKSDLVIGMDATKRGLLNLHKIEKNQLFKIDIDFDKNKLIGKLKEIFSEKEDKTAAITASIDISLISRRNIAEIMSCIFLCSPDFKIQLYVFYGLAVYTPPDSSDRSYNKHVKPVNSFFNGWAKPGLPVMTIVGLGYEENKALGAVEYLESSETIIFIPNSSECKYKHDVLEKNKILISRVDNKNIFNYLVHEPSDIIFKLDSLISGYKHKNKVVVFPFGPRIFFTCALIATTATPEASVWSVSSEDEQLSPRDDRECKEFICFSCIISSVEE